MWYYHNGYYLGMHWGWWLLWLVLIVWIFVIPSGVPVRNKIKREGTLFLLQKRLIRGEIDFEEYEEKKATLLRN
jgi:putative membrane protein